jgi:DNA repair protein RecO (recombination protein O)
VDYQSTALVLRTYRLNESDKILHLYSKEHGPMQCIAKGAYRVNSKFNAKAQVLNCLDLLVASGRNLDILKEARLVQSFSGIHSSYEALTLACFAIDVLNHIAINDDNYEEPFNLITNYLTEMEKISKNSDALILSTCKYLWELVYLLGYMPELHTCSLTNLKRSANEIPQYFDFENGAITSSKAYRAYHANNPYQDNIQELRPGVFNTLIKLERSLDSSDGQRSTVNAEHTLKFLHKHLSRRIQKEFKSWKLVEEILTPSLFMQTAA